MIQANADAHGFYDSVIMPYKGKLESGMLGITQCGIIFY